jgi:hypothetical protein
MNAKAITSTSRVQMSFVATLWSLRWSLLFSIALGLMLVLISFIGAGNLKFEGVVWAVAICVALTLGKTLTKRNEVMVALFGLFGVLLAKVINDQTLLNYDAVDVIRILLYPLLGWVVVRLERADQTGTAHLLQTWLFPMLVLPLLAGVIVAITENPPSKVLAEIVFAGGCAMILHLQKAPRDMDPLATLVMALVAGAAASTKDSAVPVLKDAHAGLKELIDRKAGGAINAGDLNAMLRIAEKKPADRTRLALLHEELRAARLHEDTEVLNQARLVLQLIRQHEPMIARQYSVT